MSSGTDSMQALATSELETLLKRFLDPAVPMTLDEQLGAMARFLHELGCPPMPWLDTLYPNSQALLKSIISNQPGRRVLPVPLLSLVARKAAAAAAGRAFPEHYQFTEDSVAGLWTPGPHTLYERLLASPDDTLELDGIRYGLGYRHPDGRVMIGRKTWIAAMTKAGHVVRAANSNTAWIFPVVDIAVKTRHHGEWPRLLADVSPTPLATPETELFTLLLHQANGAIEPDLAISYVNEAIYEVDTHGQPQAAPAFVSHLTWQETIYGRCTIRAVCSPTQRITAVGSGVREAINGLRAASA